MRALLVVLVALLALSAWLAPRMRAEREARERAAPFVTPDPSERARLGREQRALGLMLGGYGQRVNADETDWEAWRGRIGAAFTIAAVALDQPQLTPLVVDHVADYVRLRDRLDPDGSWLRAQMEHFLRERLDHEYWLAQAGAATYLAARDDPRGHARLHEWMTEGGPLYLEFCPYVRRWHPNWIGVRPVVEYFLDSDTLEARVHTATTLLEYHGLYGVGADLLDGNRDAIRATLLESARTMRPATRDPRKLAVCEATLLGLAMLGGPEAEAAIEQRTLVEFGGNADLLRLARIAAGLDPMSTYELGSLRWSLLEPGAQEAYFRAACWHLAQAARIDPASLPEAERASRAERFARLRALVEAGTREPTAGTRVYCMHVLAHHVPAVRNALFESAMRAGPVVSLFAACLARPDDPVPALLPAIASREPDFSALAAVSLGGSSGPPPIHPLPFAP